jgi:SAM-dependent methyltransferase
MQESSKQVVRELLKALQPDSVLDCPAGNGWLLDALPGTAVDGIDLYAESNTRYRRHLAHDLDQGIPTDLPTYNLIVCCEGIEHLSNPGLFLRTAWDHMNPDATLIVTTPNTWYPAAKLQHSVRGFFPGFPCLIGKIDKGQHMHIMPWSFPQLYLYLRITGYTTIQLHQEPLSRPKYLYERLLGWPQILYCRHRRQNAASAEETLFWRQAGSRGSVFGRHLIVSATR